MNVTLVSIESSPSLIFPIMQDMLKREGHRCNLIHVSLHRYDEVFLRELAEKIVTVGETPGLIGISTLTNSFSACKSLIGQLRNFTQAKIIVGGIHPTVKPEEALTAGADYVCVGEGEYALLELAGKLDRGEPADKIPNIYTRKDGRVVANPLRPLVHNLDDLPVPPFDLKHFYIYYRGKILSLEQNPELIYEIYPVIYFIITSRGCPYVCTYCLNSALIQIDKSYRRIRRRSNRHIIEELKNLKKVYHKKVTIGFVDDDFCAQSEENLQDFLKLYKEEIGLPFFVASTPHSMTARKMKMLVDGGLTRLEIGIQSINDDVNKKIYKRASLKNKVVEAINIVSPYRHQVTLNFDLILDNPWESDDARLETLRFLYTIPRPVQLNMYSLNLYPGTELYYRALEEGKLKDEQKEIYQKNHMVDINPDAINTLYVLCIIYKFPSCLTELLAKLMRICWVKSIFKKATRPLLSWSRLCQNIQLYNQLMFKSLRTGDKENFVYLIKLPFRKFFRQQRRVTG